MHRTIQRVKRGVSALAVVGLLGGSAFGWAQTFEGVATLRTTEVYPGKNALFEEALAKVIEATRQVTPESGFSTQVAGLGPGARYYSLSFYEKFSDMRPEPLLVQAFGDEEAGRIVAMFAESVKGTAVQAFIPRADLSRTRELDSFEVVWTVLITVKPGMADQYEEYLKQVVEATTQADPGRFWFTYAPSAGAANVYRIAIPMNWTDLDRRGLPIAERLEKAFGERRAAAIMEQGRSATEHVESLLTIARPDLSYVPAD